MATVDGSAARLRETLSRAVDRGVITLAQAEQIVALTEPDGAAAPPDARTPVSEPSHAKGLVTEVLGYVGGALATVSALIITAEFWADLLPLARVALLAVVAAALLAAGTPLGAAQRTAVARLGSFLWGLSAVSFAFGLYVAGADMLFLAGERAALLAAWATAAYGALLWWRRPRALQQVATFVAIVVGVGTGLVSIDVALGSWAGVAIWGVGTAWLLLAWGGLVPPTGAGYALGGIAALAGPITADVTAGRGELLLGLATAAALVTAGSWLRRTVLLTLGILGLLAYLPQVVLTYFADQLSAPIALFVTGVALLTAALALSRWRPGSSEAFEAGGLGPHGGPRTGGPDPGTHDR